MRTLLFSIMALAGAARLSAQDQPLTIQVDVPLVSLSVAVSDSTGKSITNLTKEDFLVLEDGVPQTLQNFTPGTTPYNIILLLDCSGSTQERLVLLSGAMSRFVDQLRSVDRVAIAEFGSEVKLLSDWGPGRNDLVNFEPSPVCNATDFYGALDWAAKKLRLVNGRRGVIVFTDGYQTDVAREESLIDEMKIRQVVPPSEDREFQKVLRTVQEVASPFYFVAVNTDLNPGIRYAGSNPDLRQIRARMEELADLSGGRILFPTETRDVQPFFTRIGRELGTAYSIGYTPATTVSEGKLRKIDVRVLLGNYQVRLSRDSYTR